MEDFIGSLGALALGSRLKRLSDALMQDGARIYQSLGNGFEPRWFPVFAYLYRQGPTSITGLASGLGVSHPAINKVANELIAARLAAPYRDRNDKRKRVLALTREGREKYEQLEATWRSIRQALQSAVDEAGGDFLAALEGVEASFRRSSFLERFEAQRDGAGDGIRITGYQAQLAGDFERLNRAWIEHYFALEEADLKVLRDPGTSIVGQGGDVLFALDDTGRAVGTCALLRLSDDKAELAKMAVDERLRGREVGRLLGEAVVERAREMGFSKLVLESNRKLAPALGLYRKLGFEEQPFPHPSDYARADIYMELPLAPARV